MWREIWNRPTDIWQVELLVPRGGIEPPTLRFSVSVASLSSVCSTQQHLKILRSSPNSFARIFIRSLSRLQQGCKVSSHNEYRVVVNQVAVTFHTIAGDAREVNGVAHCEPH